MAVNSFRYPFDTQSALDPWRQRLGQDFDPAVALLSDRDRALEDFLAPLTRNVSDPTGFTIAPLRIGPSPAGAYSNVFASIDHTGRAYTSPGNYMMLGDTLNTYVNAPTTGGIFLRINNADTMHVTAGNIEFTNNGGASYGTMGGNAWVLRNGAGTDLMVLDGNTLRSNVGFTMNQLSTFYLRGFGDGNHRIFVPAVSSQYSTGFNVDGPVYVGFNNYIFATGTNGHWQMQVVANGIGIFGSLFVGNGGNNNPYWNPETITLDSGGASGISMGQRTRGAADNTRRMVIYPSNDTTKYWIDGFGEHFVIGPAASGIAYTSSAYIAVPQLGGGTNMTLQAGGSWQIGIPVSSGRVKTNVRTLKETPDPDSGHQSPIFKLRPARFNWKQAGKHPEGHWKHDGVANADELNSLFPNGFAGLIAEEVAAVAPDAVTYAAGPEASQHQIDPNNPPTENTVHKEYVKGQATGLDNDRLIAYLIDAVQYLKEEVDQLRPPGRAPIR